MYDLELIRIAGLRNYTYIYGLILFLPQGVFHYLVSFVVLLLLLLE